MPRWVHDGIAIKLDESPAALERSVVWAREDCLGENSYQVRQAEFGDNFDQGAVPHGAEEAMDFRMHVRSKHPCRLQEMWDFPVRSLSIAFDDV